MRGEMKKRKAKTPRQKAKEKLMLLVKGFVYRRDEHTCQKCGQVVSGNNCQASHVIPVGQDTRLSFDPQNMKVMCYHDHLWWHEESCGLEWFKEKWPRRWEHLELQRFQNRGAGTIPMSWFEERIEFYVGLEKGLDGKAGAGKQSERAFRFAIRN